MIKYLKDLFCPEEIQEEIKQEYTIDEKFLVYIIKLIHNEETVIERILIEENLYGI